MEKRTGLRLLRLTEVGERLAVGRSTLYEMIGRGELPTVKIGRAVRVSEVELDNFIAEMPSRREEAAHASA